MAVQPAVSKTSASASVKGGVLQRACACGNQTNEGEYAHARALVSPPTNGTPVFAGSGFARDFSRVPAHSKTEAAYNAPTPKDKDKKVEAGTGALIGLGIGAGAGAIIGGLVGGPLGALLGAGIGALVGAGIGALIGALSGGGIKWATAGYASDAANGPSTTVERPFNVAYKANADQASNVWRLQVTSIEGGADINVHQGGSRDPFASPPTTEAEAQDAVAVMKGYYTRGSRGAWHTEAASRAHEEHHYSEWKCSSENYWPATKSALETLTAPLAAHANEGAAVTAMRAGAGGADAKVTAFKNKAHDYWFTLSDSASSRPYAAGQLVLNNAIRHVQGLASSQGWTVPAGTDSPSSEEPCYQPWLAYVP